MHDVPYLLTWSSFRGYHKNNVCVQSCARLCVCMYVFACVSFSFPFSFSLSVLLYLFHVMLYLFFISFSLSGFLPFFSSLSLSLRVSVSLHVCILYLRVSMFLCLCIFVSLYSFILHFIKFCSHALQNVWQYSRVIHTPCNMRQSRELELKTLRFYSQSPAPEFPRKNEMKFKAMSSTALSQEMLCLVCFL